MQFQKKTSLVSSSSIIRILFKILLIFLFLFIGIILVDKIDFPAPNKKIEKSISNEKLKIVK